jgi:splicing factor 3A subunit 3
MATKPTLESMRQAHEDLERLQHLGAAALALSTDADVDASRIPESHPARSSVHSAEHLAVGLATEAHARARVLAEGYSGWEAESAISGMRNPLTVLSEFYASLRDVKAVHHADGSSLWDGARADAALVESVPNPPAFSGEEGGGRYLDLHQQFVEYLNIVYQRPRPAVGGKQAQGKSDLPKKDHKHSKKRRRGGADLARDDGQTGERAEVQRIDYLEYLKRAISDPKSVPSIVRGSHVYEQYLTGVLEYLVAFTETLHPLADVRELVEEAEQSRRVDLLARVGGFAQNYSNSAELLEGLGAGGVRDALFELGLKCGGRPEDRARRLWEMVLQAKEGADDSESAPVVGRRILLEGLVSHVLSEMLAEEMQRTVTNVEKKQSLSWAELEAERVVEEAVAERSNVKGGEDVDDEEDDEKPLYNPKDVPLGWDGKPIPFWLYKLHGLNHEFRCEICGGTSYKGPRAFERHFADAQHVHGLRCLEISYSKQYYMVTRISDAVKLRDKISSAGKDASFDPDLEMEYEDSSGNVLNRKTYQDLERQGLLS